MSNNNENLNNFDIKIEREIYEKWLKKCKEDAILKRDLSEQNNFNRIKFERAILNQAAQYPNLNKVKSFTPYLHPSLHRSKSMPEVTNRNNNENEYELYTLDGYPRHNFERFYQRSNGASGTFRGSTDVTNVEKYEKIANGSYDAYRAKNKEYLEYNKFIADDNLRYKDYLFGEKKKMNEERLRESERIKQLEFEEKEYENEKKRVYKKLLDNQVKVKVPSKIGGLFYNTQFKDSTIKFSNPQLYMYTPENTFINRNKLVEVNPYSLKNPNIGYSTLEHNPILNPVFDYRYNKYLFPRNNSTFFRQTGYNLIKH